MIDMTSTNRLRCRVAIRWLFCTSLCLVCSFFTHAQLTTLTEKVSIKLSNTTALKILQELDRQSVYAFSYTQTQLDKISIAAFNQEQVTLGKALELLSAQAGLVYQVSEKVIAVKVAARVAPDPAALQGKPGKISGVVRSVNNEVMPGVSVSVEGMEKGITTSVSGDYVVTLPAGTYTLLVSFIGYQTKRISDVVVKEGELTDLSVALERKDSRQLEAVVVTSSARRESVKALLMTQKNNASMTDGISAEQIRVTPDNNTGQVLKRVSGITVQNDKFVTIRGVSDRYNNVLINGASLPSTEPNRRNFSFDIIPSSLVDNVVVNKTATPDLPGEFTGGLVQVNSKDVPAENFLQVLVGTGFNTASANKDFLSFRRDKQASIGRIDADRKWFGDGRAFDQLQYIKSLYAKDTATIRRINKQIPDRWQRYSAPYMPQQNYQLSGGVNKRFANNQSLGFVAAVTYLNEQFYEEGNARSLQNYDFNIQRYRYNTTIGGLFNMAYKSKKHKIAWKNLYNDKYSNQFDDRYGYQISNSRFENRSGEVTLSSRMMQTRLEGEHTVSRADIRINWYGDYIKYTREQPDGRFLVGTDVDSGKHMYRYNFNERSLFWGGLYASQLKEKRYNTGVNVSVPFQIAKERQLFKTGYAYSKRDADFDATGLRIVEAAGASYTEGMQGLPYAEIVSPAAVAAGKVEYTPSYIRNGTTGDRYTGKQILQAGYAMLDLKVLKKLRLTGGLRFEDNEMTLSTVFYDANGSSAFHDSAYREKDWLPSVNIIYSVTDKFNIRGAFSKTLARPEFVERSPYIYYDFVEQVQVIGQYALVTSRIKNYDIRFEYYPSGNEIFSASLFYKDFDKPVERFYLLGNPTNAVMYQNLHSATAKGFEVDLRKSFDFINPTLPWLSNLFISANYTYLKGEISYLVTKSPYTQKDTNFVADGKRPIQGLSPYIINAGLNYQGKVWGFNIAYNRFGRRIVNGGTNATIIQYENSRDIVDIQLSTKLFKQKAELKFNIGDLLNQYTIIYSNNTNGRKEGYPYPTEGDNNDPKGDAYNEALDFENYKVKRGANFLITLSYKL
ncbi:TonB-dependent receptor [Paraflavitalea soli]|uniref:TonB-dependent receptor n=2 Tax=Paraflavitalea soli TaxID=2315862 RepID=A0A3B7ML38_9BACT|nr:TonB-dependent receptor [Paraflavitalea soli]